jgi:hypothetical protein
MHRKPQHGVMYTFRALAAYTLADLGVTDKQFGNRVKITTNFIY